MTRCLVQALFLLCTVFGQMMAQKADVDLIKKRLGIPSNCCNESLIVQKPLPNQPGISIVAIPASRIDDDVQVMYIDLHLLYVNNQNNSIVRKGFFKGVWISDATRLVDLQIDRAHYQISDETRAFGLRAGYSGSSRANPYEGDELSLFIAYEGTFRQILKDFNVARLNGENNSVVGEPQNLETLKQKTFLIMTNHRSLGFFDIQTKSSFRKKVIENDKVVSDSTYAKIGLLRCNGQVYIPVKQVP